jgi:hypothetical protein
MEIVLKAVLLLGFVALILYCALDAAYHKYDD